MTPADESMAVPLEREVMMMMLLLLLLPVAVLCLLCVRHRNTLPCVPTADSGDTVVAVGDTERLCAPPAHSSSTPPSRSWLTSLSKPNFMKIHEVITSRNNFRQGLTTTDKTRGNKHNRDDCIL
jgi:hypothetical protein